MCQNDIPSLSTKNKFEKMNLHLFVKFLTVFFDRKFIKKSNCVEIRTI